MDVRGIASTKTRRRGAQYGGSSALTAARSSSSVGATSRTNHERGDSWPHSASGVPATATSAIGAAAAGRPRPARANVLTAGDDEVATAPVDKEAAVVEPAAQVAGREPAVDERVGAVAVAPQQHRSAEEDLAPSVSMPHLDAVEGTAVIHDAAAGLGHPVGRHDVRRARRPAAPHRRARSMRNTAGSMRRAPSRPGTQGRAAGQTATGSKPGSTVSDVPRPSP